MASIKGIWCFKDTLNFNLADLGGDGLNATTITVSFSLVGNSQAFTSMKLYPPYNRLWFDGYLAYDDSFESDGWISNYYRFINIDYETDAPEDDVFYKWFLANAVYVTDQIDSTLNVNGAWRFNKTLIMADHEWSVACQTSKFAITGWWYGEYAQSTGICWSTGTDIVVAYASGWNDDSYRYITIDTTEKIASIDYCWLLMNAVNIDPGYVSGEYQFKRGVDTPDEENGETREFRGLPSFTTRSGQQCTAIKLDVNQEPNIDWIYYGDGNRWNEVYSRGWTDHQLDRIINFGETPKYIANGEFYAWLMANTTKVTKKIYTENCIAEIAEAVRELTGSAESYSVYDLADAVYKYINR